VVHTGRRPGLISLGIVVKVGPITYDVSDHDTSTSRYSRTHFVNFAIIYCINDLESRLEVIWGRWLWHQSKARRPIFDVALCYQIGFPQ